MGQFSWLDCVTGKQILDDVRKTSYVLVPAEFGGGHIEEECYDGYGNFDLYDIYDLVVDWNKDYIPEYIKEMQAGNWEARITDYIIQQLQYFYEGKEISCDKRELGIALACYDEDNERLEYPIKITYDPNAVYEQCEPSPSDPDQGWGGAEPCEMFYAITAKLPDGVKFNKSAITKLVKKVFEDEVEGEFDVTIRDALTIREDEGYEPDDEEGIEYIPDNMISIHVVCIMSDPDYSEDVRIQIYEIFEQAGYEVVDVYYDSN